MRYGYNKELEKKLIKSRKTGVVGVFVGLISLSIFLSIFETGLNIIITIVIIVMSAFSILITVSMCLSVYTNDKVRENLPKCYFEFHDSYICGYAFTNIQESGNGHYFEIKYEDVRFVNYETDDYYNLIIDHVNGTCKLSVDRNEEIALKLEDIVEYTLYFETDMFDEN